MGLSARQALICAALTGWKGDGVSPWPCPQTEDTIVAWAASYLGSKNGPQEVFAVLVEEGLFFRVLYPIFAVPVYYCSYAVEFLDQLPETAGEIIAGANSIDDLIGFWEAEFNENNEEYGPAWTCWGLCAGQGGEGDGATIGPCLGPGCYWFTDDKAKCQWELHFADVARTGWPNTVFLSGPGPTGNVSAVRQCMEGLQQAAPDFPWPKV
jgi:hypothetical protein